MMPFCSLPSGCFWCGLLSVSLACTTSGPASRHAHPCPATRCWRNTDPHTYPLNSGMNQRAQRLTFWVRKPADGGGLPREGVVAEKFVPSLGSLSSLGFEERNLGCPGNFAGMSRTPGVFKRLCKQKVRAHFSFPINGRKHPSRDAIFLCEQ